MSYKQLLQQALCQVYGQDNDTEEMLRQYFDPSYRQCINGEELDFSGFLAHVTTQKQRLANITFDYKHQLEEGDQVFSHYCPRGVNAEGDLVEAEVHALFKFQNKKIIHCHGQVRLLQGRLQDADME